MTYRIRRQLASVAAAIVLLPACGSTVGERADEGRPSERPSATDVRGAPPTGRGVTQRGWDDEFVYLGVTTAKDVQAAASSIGASGLDAGDQEGQALAVAAELNRRGGVLGRQVKVVFHDVRTIDAARNPDRVGNETCTHFTQDRPVVAVFNAVPFIDRSGFRGCLAYAQVVLLSASVAAVDSRAAADLAPYLVQLAAPTWDALAPVLVARLAAQGWFGGWETGAGTPGRAAVKVGVLVPSDPTSARVAAIITRALDRAGRRDVDSFAYLKAAEMMPAVLRFAGTGVTHVIAANADLFSFQLAAESQSYRPRYAVTSANAPQTFIETNSPKAQNVGAMGVGWAPPVDVGTARDPGDVGAGERECRQILRVGGQQLASRLAEAVAFALCDGFRLVVSGAVASRGLTGRDIARGLQLVAPAFAPGLVFRVGLRPDRLFVPGAVRDLAWDATCGCMTYADEADHPL
ncbi:MAG TPA: hypothetical protein VNA14_06780 [Mycobacteriales bacterium]|nr:hypothetical protein [Mycobacteriales bacterium]